MTVAKRLVGNGLCRRGLQGEERIIIRLDPVAKKELAKAIEIEPFPKGVVRLVQPAALHNHAGRAGTFPVADEFYHAKAEEHPLRGLRIRCVFDLERRCINPQRRAEAAKIFNFKIIADAKRIPLLREGETVVVKDRVSPAKGDVFFLVFHADNPFFLSIHP